MSLTHKERTWRAFHQQPVDRIPTQINYTQAMGEKMAAYFGVTLDALPGRLDNHLIRVDISYERPFSDDVGVEYDWWGVGFSVDEEGYFPSVNPLAKVKKSELETFSWPDPHASDLLDKATEIISADAGGHFIVPNFGFALFERAWALRGFDTFLMDLLVDPEYAEELLERIMQIQLTLIERFVQLQIDGGYFGDDYGAQKNMLFSSRLWRKMFKPRLARLFAPFREAGLPVLMHSDGQINSILPDLVEIGVTVFNPAQPEVLDHSWLEGTFGGRLAYYGGVSTQTVLPAGSPDDVRSAVANCRKLLAPNDTGLLIAPSHRLMADIPLENVAALSVSFATLNG